MAKPPVLPAQPNPHPEQAGGGIVPTLAELVALRAVAAARRAPRQGRLAGAGRAPSPLRGRGMEYAESRGYVASNDVRHIDWRVTARTGRAHTKLYQAERERLTLVVADTSPALYFGTRVRFKSVQAARAGAVGAWAAVRDGDRVAALRAGSTEPPVTPAGGARGALRVLDALARWYTRPPPDDAGLDAALGHARRLLRPGSRLLVLADPGSVAALPPARWPVLAQHHEVVLVLLTDPLERSPPHAALAFRSGGHRLELDLADDGQRQRWAQQFDAPVEAALATLPARGVRVHALSTDAPSESWLPLLGRARPLVA